MTQYNATAATLTKNRTGGDWCPASGMCVTCVEGCIRMYEIGKSAYRGHEVTYPQPFGFMTTASQRAYPIDLSHFNIMVCGVYTLGNGSEPVCQIAVEPNRIDMILLRGLNPVAAAAETGIGVENTAESGMIDFERLSSFWQL